MLWPIFAFLTAFFESLNDVFSKKNLKNIDEYTVAWSLRFFALPFLIPLLFFIEIPSLGNHFWRALVISGSLNIVTTILYMKAIKRSDLSITVPMITFTPLFLLLTSPLIVGEFPSFMGLIGVLLIVACSYTLNIRKWNEGYLAPFKALLAETGPRLMLLVAFIWSITSNFDKIGVQNSSAIFWVIAMNIFLTLAILPIMLYKSKKSTYNIRTNYKALVPLGLFSALALIFQMTAISLTLVAYVISIKRTSAVMSVLFGHLIFKEKGLKERLSGAIIMVVGVLFIVLS
jgi:uncharacterized membrane protein